MTVIVWDGTTLAADKMLDCYHARMTTTKIRRFKDRSGEYLLGASGDAGAMGALMDWFVRGANPDKWPACQSTEHSGMLLVVSSAGWVKMYTTTPYGYDIQDPKTAQGSGRDYALAAMAMGADATKAVEIASQLDPSCGMGIDTLTFGG